MKDSSFSKYNLRGMFNPTAPVATTWARSRAIDPANSTGSLEGVSAQIRTPSHPRPREKLCATSSAPSRRVASIPNLCANSILDGSMSIPSTRQPAAEAIPAVNRPSNPKPITATVSPICVSASRKPCSATAPKVVNAAESKSTLSGRGARRFCGTKLYSA